MIYFDSETIGLTGPMVILQWAEDDGPIHIHEIWNEPIPKTLALLEKLCYHPDGVCAFNLVFDWFHVNKIYNILRELYDRGARGIPVLADVVEVEAQNPSEYCLKPQKALDIMLVARRGKYQYVMNRKPIWIRKIPRIIAKDIVKILEERINIPDICFAKSKDNYRWKIKDVEGAPELCSLKLEFKGSTSLRALAKEILGEDKADWPIPKYMTPTELSWWPYGQHGKRPWRLVAGMNIAMWQTNEEARHYAWLDVDLLRKLHKVGFPEEQGGDTDSELAASIGATRWRGFSINHAKVQELINRYEHEHRIAPRGHEASRRYLEAYLSPAEISVLKDTSKETLEALVKHASTEEAQKRAARIMKARKARLRLTMLNRLLKLPRFHPEFKVIGTKSNRQSGGSEVKVKGNINPQGIPREREFRSCFTFAFEGERLSGGDAKSFEVTIIDAVLPDPVLHEELLSGKNFHALMGEIWYNVSYEDMMYEKNLDTGNTKYDKSKQGDFAMAFGAEKYKLSKVLNLEEEEVEESLNRGRNRYKEMFRRREEIAMSFCSMRQPGGLGTKVIWHEPSEFIESIFGFKRYFTLENEICRTLYELANKPPERISKSPQYRESRIVRRAERGSQSVLGALQSAIYAAAFSLQAACMRAACNHIIQSPGGHITKFFQLAVWEYQPRGVCEWIIRAFNMHDELLVVDNGTVDTTAIRDRIVTEYRKQVPLLAWEWKPMNSWGDK